MNLLSFYLLIQNKVAESTGTLFCNVHTRLTNQPIRKTCPCNEYPRKPHFYIVKLGCAGVYLFFLFLLQNRDCGYSLEPPHNLCFGAKIRKIGLPLQTPVLLYKSGV